MAWHHTSCVGAYWACADTLHVYDKSSEACNQRTIKSEDKQRDIFFPKMFHQVKFFLLVLAALLIQDACSQDEEYGNSKSNAMQLIPLDCWCWFCSCIRQCSVHITKVPGPLPWSAVLEGDIVLTSEQEASFEATSNPSDPFSPQNAVVRNQRSLWPQGIVPYILDSSLNSESIAS